MGGLPEMAKAVVSEKIFEILDRQALLIMGENPDKVDGKYRLMT